MDHSVSGSGAERRGSRTGAENGDGQNRTDDVLENRTIHLLPTALEKMLRPCLHGGML